MLLTFLRRIAAGEFLQTTYNWCDRVFRITGWVAVSSLFDYLYATTQNRSVWIIAKIFDLLLLWLVINIAFSLKLKRFEESVGPRYGLYLVLKLCVAFAILFVLTQTMIQVAFQLSLDRASSAG